MNEATKLWLAALRSGEYKKDLETDYSLRNGNTYCVMGVLADLASKNGIIDPPKRNDDGEWEYDKSTALLSSRVVDWAGLSDRSGTYHEAGRRRSLMAYNDNEEASFTELADLIESNPPGLFKQENKQ